MFAFIYKIGSYSASARWLLNSCHHASKKFVKYCDFVYSFAIEWYYKKRIIEDN